MKLQPLWDGLATTKSQLAGRLRRRDMIKPSSEKQRADNNCSGRDSGILPVGTEKFPAAVHDECLNAILRCPCEY